MAPVSAGGSGVAVRLAAKVRCALVPPKPKEERPPLAESGAVELGHTKGNAKGKLGLNYRENRDMMWIQGGSNQFYHTWW